MGSVFVTHLCSHGMYVYMYVCMYESKLTTYLRLVPTYPPDELHFCSSHRTPLPLPVAQRSQTARCSEHDLPIAVQPLSKAKHFRLLHQLFLFSLLHALHYESRSFSPNLKTSDTLLDVCIITV